MVAVRLKQLRCATCAKLVGVLATEVACSHHTRLLHSCIITEPCHQLRKRQVLVAIRQDGRGARWCGGGQLWRWLSERGLQPSLDLSAISDETEAAAAQLVADLAGEHLCEPALSEQVLWPSDLWKRLSRSRRGRRARARVAHEDAQVEDDRAELQSAPQLPCQALGTCAQRQSRHQRADDSQNMRSR